MPVDLNNLAVPDDDDDEGTPQEPPRRLLAPLLPPSLRHKGKVRTKPSRKDRREFKRALAQTEADDPT